MNLSSNAQATLLLTSYFSRRGNGGAKPLGNVEWGRFAFWLQQRGMTPGDLLLCQAVEGLNGWHDAGVEAERVSQLLGRGHALALAVEKWQRAGLWVLTRSDEAYPRLLKQRLKASAPPVLYGCGNARLLSHGGLAVVGSREVDESDMDFARAVGGKAAASGISIVSGGARGVDEAAMLGAMEAGGGVVGVLADKLLLKATSSKWRSGLMDDNLVLVSPFYPEAGFNAGNAMARNKYIYCLSQTALVVRAGERGGTIAGAKENLKRGWVPLWVKPTVDADAANNDLVKEGAHWCEGHIGKLDVSGMLVGQGQSVTLLVDTSRAACDASGEVQGSLFGSPFEQVAESDASSHGQENAGRSPGRADEASQPVPEEVDFYNIFVAKLPSLLRGSATPDDLSRATNVSKSQLQKWLKQAEDDGVVKKLIHPVRYEWAEW